MKRALSTFFITVLIVAIIITGGIYPEFGIYVVSLLFFALLWAMVNATIGHHFEERD